MIYYSTEFEMEPRNESQLIIDIATVIFPREIPPSVRHKPSAQLNAPGAATGIGPPCVAQVSGTLALPQQDKGSRSLNKAIFHLSAAK